MISVYLHCDIRQETRISVSVFLFPATDFTNACVRTFPIFDQQWWPSITIGTVADNGVQWIPNQSPSATQCKKGCSTRGKEKASLDASRPICLFIMYMRNFVFSSSSRLVSDGLVTACDCGTPCTFHLIF